MVTGWRFCEKHKKRYKSGSECPFCEKLVVELKVFNPSTGKKEIIDFKAKEIEKFEYTKDLKNKIFKIEVRGKLK